MHGKSTLLLALVATTFAAGVLAQPAPPTGGTVIASEPGKAGVASTVEASAQVVAIDKAARKLSLKGPKGNVVEVVASNDVKNFDQIKVGDMVVARYVEAITFELKKAGTPSAPPTVTEGAAKAKPGEKPGVAGARQVTLVADVTAVDPQASTITLKGPKGNELTLPVRNPAQFSVVKVGDKVEVQYTEALALAVEPAPKAAAEKKK